MLGIQDRFEPPLGGQPAQEVIGYAAAGGTEVVVKLARTPEETRADAAPRTA